MADGPFRLNPGRPGRSEKSAPTRRVDSRLPDWWLPIIEAIAERRGLRRHSGVREAVWEWMQRYAIEGELPKD